MSEHTNIQIIRDGAGKPAFVVIPYSDYVGMKGNAPEHKTDAPIPNEVVGQVIKDGMTIVQAWREHLGLNQVDVADRLGISQPAYAKQEKSDNLRKSTKEKIAAAFRIDVSQLDW